MKKTNFGRNNPFILQLEAAILKDGFKDLKQFVWRMIQAGNDFSLIHLYIEQKYGLSVHYQTVINNLRHLAPGSYTKGAYNFAKYRATARRLGYKDIKTMLTDFAYHSLPKKEMCKILGVSPHIVDRLAKIYNVDLTVIPNDDARILGFKSIAAYCYWLKKANKLGYDTVVDVINALFNEGYSYREAAWRLGVSYQALWNRCKKAKILKNEMEEKENVSGTIT